jgi:hypothetical protein
MAELRAQAGTRKWVAKKQPLQSAHTENVGWINYLPQSTDVDFWADCINSWIEKNIEREDNTPPLVIGLDYRAIYDGLGQDARNRLSQKEKWAKKAVHVVCKRGEKIRVTSIIRSFLQSKRFRYLGNYPSRLIPMLPYGYSPIFQAKYQEATQKHMKLTYFGSRSQTTFAFTGPDKRISFLDGSPTIRSLVLGMKARGTEKPLFLTLNPATKGNEKGGFVITYCVKYDKEAVEKLTNLAAYFHHHFGDGSLERFSPEACEQADHTKWDTENDRPITMEEQFLEDAMDDDIDWIADLGDVTFDNPSALAVVADRPLLSSAPVGMPALPNSADDDTVGTFFPGQGRAATQTEDDDTDDDDSTTNYTPTFSTANDENREARPFSEAPRAEVSEEAPADGV